LADQRIFTTRLSFDNILQLQMIDEKPAQLKEISAEDLFLEEARKDPIERMRDQILEELGLTEDGIAQCHR
jgi:hypothetical protein